MNTLLLVLIMTLYNIDCDGLNQYFTFHSNAIPSSRSDPTVPKYILWESIEEMESKLDAVVLGLMNSPFSHTTELNFTVFTHLKELFIGYNCVINVNRLIVDGLNELELISIKECSFTLYQQEVNESTNGVLIINCPFLKRIEIGNESFEKYVSCEFTNLPSLQSISIGEDCFTQVRSFTLSSRIDWML